MRRSYLTNPLGGFWLTKRLGGVILVTIVATAAAGGAKDAHANTRSLKDHWKDHWKERVFQRKAKAKPSKPKQSRALGTRPKNAKSTRGTVTTTKPTAWPDMPLDRWQFPDGTLIEFSDSEFSGKGKFPDMMRTRVVVNGKDAGVMEVEFDKKTGELIIPNTVNDGAPSRVPPGVVGNAETLPFAKAVLMRQLARMNVKPGAIKQLRNKAIVNPTSVLKLAMAMKRGESLASIASDLHIVKTSNHLFESMGFSLGPSVLEALEEMPDDLITMASFRKQFLDYFRRDDAKLYEEAKELGVKKVHVLFDVVTPVE